MIGTPAASGTPFSPWQDMQRSSVSAKSCAREGVGDAISRARQRRRIRSPRLRGRRAPQPLWRVQPLCSAAHRLQAGGEERIPSPPGLPPFVNSTSDRGRVPFEAQPTTACAGAPLRAGACPVGSGDQPSPGTMTFTRMRASVRAVIADHRPVRQAASTIATRLASAQRAARAPCPRAKRSDFNCLIITTVTRGGDGVRLSDVSRYPLAS